VWTQTNFVGRVCPKVVRIRGIKSANTVFCQLSVLAINKWKMNFSSVVKCSTTALGKESSFLNKVLSVGKTGSNTGFTWYCYNKGLIDTVLVSVFAKSCFTEMQKVELSAFTKALLMSVPRGNKLFVLIAVSLANSQRLFPSWPCWI